ncbi:MAG: 16S rRNA (cytidine(1402)-2'-O)-methyltransferase [Gammaproteobacteria bacterium]
MAETGTLYIVATPIGNLEDITHRAQRILHQVDTIVAEDTRHTAHLLNHLNIKRPLIAYHAHNENDKTDFVLQMLQDGKDIALVSDAGTPLISDPGFPLVRAAQEAGIPVVPLPGPCALITALSVSGLSPLPFYFAGFLSPKAGARTAALEALKPLTATLIFYEAPHRLLDSVTAMETVFGNRMACLGRELTKQFETVIRAPLPELVARIAADPNQQRGEAVLLVEGNMNTENTGEADRILAILLRELPLKQAVALCAEITGEGKNSVYEKALVCKGR